MVDHFESTRLKMFDPLFAAPAVRVAVNIDCERRCCLRCTTNQQGHSQRYLSFEHSMHLIKVSMRLL
jgi:hypothetical protein